MIYYFNAEVKVSFKEEDVTLPNTLTFVIRKSVEELSPTEEADLGNFVNELMANQTYGLPNGVITMDKIVSITPQISTISIHNFIENLPELETIFSRE